MGVWECVCECMGGCVCECIGVYMCVYVCERVGVRE